MDEAFQRTKPRAFSPFARSSQVRSARSDSEQYLPVVRLTGLERNRRIRLLRMSKCVARRSGRFERHRVLPGLLAVAWPATVAKPKAQVRKPLGIKQDFHNFSRMSSIDPADAIVEMRSVEHLRRSRLRP